MDESNATLNATNMLHNKKLDAVCLNVLKDSDSFGSDTNEIKFITKDSTTHIPSAEKLRVAFEILNSAKKIQE